MKASLKALLQQTQSNELLSLDDKRLDLLVQLVEQLDKWNKAYNLTSVRDPKQMLSRHIVDSLVVSPFLQGERFIDVGTGPGLPGLPLAIANPDKAFVLLDSLGKRIRFIRQVCHQLNITNVTAVQSRVEDFTEHSHSFDGVLSRAFASLNDMLNWCGHLPKAEGKFYALKGQYPQQELDELSQQYKIDQIQRLQVPGIDGERHIVIISPAHSSS
ncbi:16S rRNA (guanine(527)-N(7))-methyltransferase RsmG [Idiomarina sp. OT37-5b]|uniref:16S rRNA (guanine(527)-N(7))-methyltransferase RsmG n=1 Tax=Idiomarina sp. OT37-5b TaxID=2100422 RepID=UPI000CF973AE|nr:16S rRNA (guanine(527)-N(7))-methyltransferase RsmG [Idiomarina sp. OT37-5b]AVJ57215.1 16S rRNA (guanine(527)-N(7))-methyltransferase RsmG [Idiomarina sp. OT37-5b]